MLKKLQSEASLPTEYGFFHIMAFAETAEEEMPIVVLKSHKTDVNSIVAVRIHSECLTGDIFHSIKCDCGQQLDFSMKYIAEHGGIIIYLRQEGRGIGIINKIKTYKLQEQGLDTVQANIELGLPDDARQYNDVEDILNYLGITKIDLLTNNPDKLNAFRQSKISLVNRIPIVVQLHKESENYMNTKKNYFKHLL